MQNDTKIPLYDIHTAAFLEYKGIRLTLIKVGTRVLFEVPADDASYRLLAEFQTNPDTPLLDYVNILKRLRGRMLDARDGSGARRTEDGNQEGRK